MKISKYHGCGNSFVITSEEAMPAHVKGAKEEERISAYSTLAAQLCDVNTGVGADGFIVVREKPKLEMVFFNQDGSRAPMCGNGIRCFAHYCMEKGICEEAEYPVETLGGTMIVEVVQDEPFRAKINMGRPIFDPKALDVDYNGDNFMDQEITMEDGSTVTLDGFFMGTHHVVVFVDEIDREKLEPLGKAICNHPVFLKKTNVNFAKVVDEDTVEVLTYERGVGITLACGTGSCASVVAAHRRGLTGSKACAMLKRGTLGIEISEDGNVFMEGPSVRVFDGEIE